MRMTVHVNRPGPGRSGTEQEIPCGFELGVTCTFRSFSPLALIIPEERLDTVTGALPRASKIDLVR
jgi:hypothetical protein